MNTATQAQTQPRDLTVDDLAEILRCSRATIYRSVKEGHIRGYRVCGDDGPLRFKQEEVERLRNGKK